MRLLCIREIAVILADVRDDQQLDEVERRAAGEIRDSEGSAAESCVRVNTSILTATLAEEATVVSGNTVRLTASSGDDPGT